MEIPDTETSTSIENVVENLFVQNSFPYNDNPSTENASSPSLSATYYPVKYFSNGSQTEEYAKVLFDIRNMQVLRTSHRIAIHNFSRVQLLEIIEIYNLIVQNVNYMFS